MLTLAKTCFLLVLQNAVNDFLTLFPGLEMDSFTFFSPSFSSSVFRLFVCILTLRMGINNKTAQISDDYF